MLTANSDLQWNANNPNEGNVSGQASANGVLTQPRALNGWFNRVNPNGGNTCITLCLNLNRGYTFAATNENQCCTFLCRDIFAVTSTY